MVSPIESTLHIRLFEPHATQLHSIKSNRNSIGNRRSRVIETPNIFHHPTFCQIAFHLDRFGGVEVDRSSYVLEILKVFSVFHPRHSG